MWHKTTLLISSKISDSTDNSSMMIKAYAFKEEKISELEQKEI